MPNIETILRDHVTLQVESIDRIYLGGYLPALQRSGQLVYFLQHHRGNPYASPVLLDQMTKRFVSAIRAFALGDRIPLVEFKPGERKDDVAKRYFARFKGAEGVVFIGVAKEKVSSFRSNKARNGLMDFYRASVTCNHYYFYIFDREWGPGFIKFSSYAPFGVKMCLNGHEWAKQRLLREKIAFEPLDNGFASCADPKRLQAICDELSAEHVDQYFRKWLARIPHPLTAEDRKAGYRYQLSIWQMEVSLTQVFDRPIEGRRLFEEILRDNLDLGRPDRIQLLFDRQVRRTTPGSFRTRVVQHGVLPKLSVEYKKSRVKQYFKEERALRTETVINDPDDVGVGRRLKNLAYLRTIGKNINHRLLALERTSQNCVISPQTFESVVLPSETEGQHAPGLRFGEPRTMAVLAAACQFVTAPDGFTNAMLRERVAALHDPGAGGYTPGRMTYDLRRLRLKALIRRIPGRNRYVLTLRGRRIGLFLTKTFARIFRPGIQRLDPDLPADPTDDLARAWRDLDLAVDHHIDAAHITA